MRILKSKKGHGPVDFAGKGFFLLLGVAFLRLSGDGIQMGQSMAIFLGVLLIVLAIAGIFA